MIGVNTMMIAGAQGLCFAIPITLAITIASQLIHRGRVRRGRLGLACAPARLTRRQVRHFRLAHEHAVRIAEVESDGPGAQAGLARGDLLVALDTIALDGPDALHRLLAAEHIGEPVTLSVLRRYERVDVEVVPAERQETRALVTAPMPEPACRGARAASPTGRHGPQARQRDGSGAAADVIASHHADHRTQAWRGPACGRWQPGGLAARAPGRKAATIPRGGGRDRQSPCDFSYEGLAGAGLRP